MPEDAQKLIAEVHRAHWPQRRHNDVDLWTECRCGAGKFYNPADHSKHFAAEVDKALGGLTREWGVQMIGYDEVTVGSEGTAHYCARKHPKRWNALSRFVSGWTVTE